MLHHDDFTCFFDRAESMGNDDDGLLTGPNELVESLLHLELTLGIQGRGRLVQKQELWLANQGPCNRNALLLPA